MAEAGTAERSGRAIQSVLRRIHASSETNLVARPTWHELHSHQSPRAAEPAATVSTERVRPRVPLDTRSSGTTPASAAAAQDSRPPADRRVETTRCPTRHEIFAGNGVRRTWPASRFARPKSNVRERYTCPATSVPEELRPFRNPAAASSKLGSNYADDARRPLRR